jgi:hypothetical protein
MQISIPQPKDRNGKRIKPKRVFGRLRDVMSFTSLEKNTLGQTLYQIKISIPELSIVDNLYLTIDEEEAKFLEEWIPKERKKCNFLPSKHTEPSK